MSGDCGHGWGYHYQGASGPCYKCVENEAEAKLKAAETMRDAALQVGAKDRARLQSLEQELEAAKAFVWFAATAASKMNAQGMITPNAEIEWLRELLPKMELWLQKVGQVGIDFTAAYAAIDSAIARRTSGDERG